MHGIVLSKPRACPCCGCAQVCSWDEPLVVGHSLAVQQGSDLCLECREGGDGAGHERHVVLGLLVEQPAGGEAWGRGMDVGRCRNAGSTTGAAAEGADKQAQHIYLRLLSVNICCASGG